MKSLCEIINVNIFYGEKTNEKHCYSSLSITDGRTNLAISATDHKIMHYLS